jgi:hypothetical protein
LAVVEIDDEWQAGHVDGSFVSTADAERLS